MPERNRFEVYPLALLQHFSEAHGAGQLEGLHGVAYVAQDKIHDGRFRERQQVADAGDDDGFHGRFVDDFFEHVRRVFEHHDGASAAVLQLVFQFTRGVQRVRVYHRQARAQRAEQRDGVLQNVRHHQGNAVALLETSFPL